jgi:hypothetical protein
VTMKAKAKKRGKVLKVIKSIHPSIPEKAEIEIEDGDDLYKEIRVENALEDGEGRQVKLKEKARVDIVIEADGKATTRKED